MNLRIDIVTNELLFRIYVILQIGQLININRRKLNLQLHLLRLRLAQLLHRRLHTWLRRHSLRIVHHGL